MVLSKFRQLHAALRTSQDRHVYLDMSDVTDATVFCICTYLVIDKYIDELTFHFADVYAVTAPTEIDLEYFGTARCHAEVSHDFII